ncbi:chromosome partitioning protein [Catenulispora rubra]|uniref:chromosome partitioning protein n=1 Tax=Catenulispora rubra TaxID=280293 RepID=UPI001891FC5F|nr:chromosome partitioning protein [Catenulispora rubra]
MLITVGSIKSGAATTTALALGATWPSNATVVVVEADPSGGDVASLFGLEREPGLVSLSAAARARHEVGLLTEHAQALPGGLRVVAAPPGAEQAGGAVGLLGRDAGPLWKAAASAEDLVVIVDVGRLDPGSPAHVLVAAADAALLVARPTLNEAHALAARLDGLISATGAAGTRLHLVLHGEGYPAEQVSQSLAFPVTAHLPHDAKAAAILSGAGRGELRRTALAGAAHRLGQALLDEHHAAQAEEAPEMTQVLDMEEVA